MIVTYSNRTYRITYQSIALVENALGNPNLIQISLTTDCEVKVAPMPEYDIAYLPNGEYRSWQLTGINTKLNRKEQHFIYARLERASKDALLVFSVNDYNVDGTTGEGTAPSEYYYYIKLGKITATDAVEGATVMREVTLDYGYLATPADMDSSAAGWNDLFELTLDGFIRPLKRFTSFIVQGTLNIIGKLSLNDKEVSDVAKESDQGEMEVNDEALPTTSLLMGKYLTKLRGIFLNKDQEDSTDFVQTFNKGLKMGKYTTGLLGTGGAVLIDENGNSHAEFDYLNIRKKALFTEITVQELKHIGGALIISPASMIISSMEETADGYKCYFNRKNSDGKTIYNEFEVGDQGRCQTFNLEKQENGQVGNRYWWRLVTAIGDDYVVFSKADADTGSDIPKEGDQVSQLGNRNDPTRQNAQIYSAYGSDAPSRKMYQGINSYSLVDKVIKDEYFDVVSGRFKERTYGDAYIGNREGTDYLNNEEGKGLEVSGTVHIKQGSTGAANLTDLPDEVYRAVKIGGENLLRNTGFTGDYKPVDLSTETSLDSEKQMYSPSLEHWKGTATVIALESSPSGYACTLGDISQDITLTVGETYMIGYFAKGSQLAIVYGDTKIEQALTSEYQYYSYRFKNQDGNTFRIFGAATIYALKLERGTVAADWCPHPSDPPSVTDRFKETFDIQAALQGSTQIYGGLNLTTMIMLGEWVDGIMKQVNAGISGIYNEDTDIAYWAGGTYEQAIATVHKILTGERPTDAEWKSLAKFVVTHGGDVFIRGYIYAMGGYFRGVIDLGDGVTHFEADGTGWIGKNEKGEKIIVVGKDAVDINAILHARKGSTIGNLTISESGSLYGFSSTIVRAMSGIRIEPYTRGELNSFVKDNISTASTFYLVFNGFTNEGTYDIYLPNANNFLSKKPEMTEGVLTLTFIVPTYYMTESIPNEATLNLKPESGSYIYDSNGNTLDMITLSKGNTIELMASIMPTSFTAAFVVNYYIKSLRQ